MEKRCLFTFSILFAALLFSICSICQFASAVEDVRPPIIVTFTEPVQTAPGMYYIKDKLTGQFFDVELEQQIGETKFVFRPVDALLNGNYVFYVRAADKVGNWKEYTSDFDVFMPNTEIELQQPNSIGVSNSTVFDVMVFTTRPCVCKHRGVPFSDFDDEKIKFFDETGDITTNVLVFYHRIFGYSVDEGFPQHLYVSCKDDLGRIFFKDFMLYADTVPPRITGAYFDPNPVAEYPADGGDLRSVLTVEASEEVICKYSDSADVDYDSMQWFPGYDQDDFDAYLESNEVTMTFPDNVTKQSFTYYVRCEDRARHVTDLLVKDILVDLTQGLKVKFNSPKAFSKNTQVFLNLSTNLRAYCVYKTAESWGPSSYSAPNAKMSSSLDDLANVHFRSLGTQSSGVHSLTVRCESPEGVGFEQSKPVEEPYTYTIDTVPPSVPVVNATSPVCANSLSATFSANDSLSGISEYRWKLMSSKGQLNNGTTTTGSVTISQNSNGSSLVLLGPPEKYYFSVAAVDGALNVGNEGKSNDITFDSTGMKCDKVPPIITVARSSSGITVTIDCKDDKSGCSTNGSTYGSSFTSNCTPSKAYVPIPVSELFFKTTTYCWSIKDNAGNYAYGSQLIQYGVNGSNVSNMTNMFPNGLCPGGVDDDKDGYGESCMLGPDCNDQDANQNSVCANGCISDMDGDGYGLGCKNGPDCNDKDGKLASSCPNGCISDNDGDGYGLGCKDGPDCDGTDSTLTDNCPSGCTDDNDGDGYGLSCPAGYDCEGEDPTLLSTCDTGCIQDTDADGFGIGCDAGLDCDGFDPKVAMSCDNGCYFDEDGDGFGFGCDLGLDCDGTNYFQSSGCANGCVSDNEGDDFGTSCGSGDDCDDTQPYITLDCRDTTECVIDNDGDGYGPGCVLGPDCGDYEINLSKDQCTENCSFDLDCNGLPDVWQEQYFNNTVCVDAAVCGPEADPDADGFTNIEEYRRGTDPNKKEDLVLPGKSVAAKDDDGDGMPDDCEKLYGLDSKNPYDVADDPDGDGLENSFECNYKQGSCVNWLNPKKADTDDDGYDDKAEVEAGTDPCDSGSYPSGGVVSLLLIILGILLVLGSTSYIVYKKYYIPLVTPKPQPVHRPTAPYASQPHAGQGVRAPMHHVAHHGPPKDVAHEHFIEEAKKKAKQRDDMFSVFGQKRERPKEVMEKIARRPETRRGAPIIAGKPAGKAAGRIAPQDDYVSKLSSVIGGDYFDKLSGMSKQEADYMGKLATIAKKKDVSLEDDQVSKLASITKKVATDAEKKKEVASAFKNSDFDKLDDFLSSGKKLDTFLKVKPEDKLKASADYIDRLSDITGNKGGIDALSSLSANKREDVLDALESLSAKKAEKAVTNMDRLSSIESKEELFKAFRQISKQEHIDKNVFSVLLSYLLKSGKINKRDVYDLVLQLEKQGVLDKGDVTQVFFDLGVKSA